jgi:flagellar biosynthetic protein FliR
MDELARFLEMASRNLPYVLLVAARVAPVVIVAPFFSLRSAPAPVRMGLIIALTMVFTPLVHAEIPVVHGTIVGLLALRELAIGAAWAIAVAVPFHVMDVAGRLADLSRGASLAEVIAPSTGDRTSPLGDLASLAACAIFYALGGHRLALAGFAEALRFAPVGVMGDGRFGLTAARIVASSLTLGVAFVAPVLVTMVVVEVGLGLVARASPRVQIFFIGMPLRAGLGIAVLALVFVRMTRLLPETIRGSLDAAEMLLGG